MLGTMWFTPYTMVNIIMTTSRRRATYVRRTTGKHSEINAYLISEGESELLLPPPHPGTCMHCRGGYHLSRPTDTCDPQCPCE